MLFRQNDDQRKANHERSDKNFFCILQDDDAILVVRANGNQWALYKKSGFEYRFHYALGMFDFGTVFRSFVNVIMSTTKSRSC